MQARLQSVEAPLPTKPTSKNHELSNTISEFMHKVMVSMDKPISKIFRQLLRFKVVTMKQTQSQIQALQHLSKQF